MRYLMLAAAALALLALSNTYAYYNITYVNTTVILNGNTSAHVVEQFTLFVSNSSYSQYESNRNAVNLSLSHWQQVLYTTQLQENLIGRGHSIYNFEFLPGPLVVQTQNGGIATLSLNYYINNVTNMSNIAPRKFEYVFNSSLFNFQSTANGQILPVDTRLNIVIPNGAQIVSVYPIPDSPHINARGSYANTTTFSWYSGELLSSFTFDYATTQSLQAEVLAYLQGIYSNYTPELYAILIIIIALAIAYLYRASKRQEQ